MSLKISSSLGRVTAGLSETGSPIRSCTRVDAWLIVAPVRRSVRQDLAILFHDLLDQVRTADDAFALGNEVFLGHVEQVEVRRAAVELRARLVRILDEVVDRLRRALLDEELLRDAFLHQLA